MNQLFEIKTKPRNPFKILTLSWFCSFYLSLYHENRHSKIINRILRITLKYIYIFLKLTKIDLKSYFELNINGIKRRIKFESLNTQFESLYGPLFVNGYELETTMLLDCIIKPNDVFIDIGSNWGYYSFFVASKDKFCGKIYAFEPHPKTFNDLLSTVKQSDLGQTIKCFRLALSNISGKSKITFPDHIRSGLAKLSHNKGVPVILDMLDNMNIDQTDIIKIDAEGHESCILKGSIKTIRRNHPTIIFESIININDFNQTLEPFQILKNEGYFFILPTIKYENLKDEIYLGSEHCSSYKDRPISIISFEIDMRERFLLHNYLNVFAIHESKRSTLK